MSDLYVSAVPIISARKENGTTIVHVSLSSGERTPLGKILSHLYYQNDDLCDLAPGRTGYPHNGGQHTFNIRGTLPDVSAFIEMVFDYYKDKPRFLEGDAIGVLSVLIFQLELLQRNV